MTTVLLQKVGIVHIIDVVLIRIGRTSRYLNREVVADAVWSRAGASAGLEHIRVRVSEDRIDMVLFVQSSGPERAREVAQRICSDVVSAAPVLTGWRLLRVTRALAGEGPGL